MSLCTQWQIKSPTNPCPFYCKLSKVITCLPWLETTQMVSNDLFYLYRLAIRYPMHHIWVFQEYQWHILHICKVFNYTFQSYDDLFATQCTILIFLFWCFHHFTWFFYGKSDLERPRWIIFSLSQRGSLYTGCTDLENTDFFTLQITCILQCSLVF